MNKLVTLVTKDIAPHAECFIETHRRWAARHGYEYECATELPWPTMAPSFSKVPLVDKALRDGYEYVVWADADIAFLKMDWDIKTLITDRLAERPELFFVAYQQQNWASWKYLCNGFMCFRNTPYTRTYMDLWADYCLNGVPNVEPGRRVVMRDFPWEQFCQDQTNRDTAYHGIYACTPKEIGGFCPTLWHDGYIADGSEPTMHFATGAWDRRAKIFKELYAKYVTP